MSILNNSLLLSADAGAAGYQISRSLRFNSADSAYLSRTPASAGNRKTWTWSGWVKRSDLSTSDQTLFSGGTTLAHTATTIIFFRNNRLCYSSITQDILQTEAVYRDASAWYHIVVALDTTQSTASSRLRFYVNGSEVTQFSTDARSAQLSQNTDYGISNSEAHGIGRFAYDGSKYFSGYLANVEFVDGSALTPASFGETNATTGQWVPKAYTGSYGTNGFRLDFSDNSAATATTLGKDRAGSNNWTPNNLSVTAGAGNDSLVDTPTSYGTGNSGGDVRGNYCTWNPLDNAGPVLANGNLDSSRATASWSGSGCRATLGVTSGKWYWEITQTSATSGSANNHTGISKQAATLNNYLGSDANGWAYDGVNGFKLNNGSGTSYGATWTTNDVIGVAFDADSGTLTFYKNGVSQGQAFSGLTSGPYFPTVSLYGTISCVVNFGQRPFAFPVSGFKALCDTNLPAPTIARPSTVMDVKLYTGNGSTQTISGLGFSPDLVWIKSRSDGFGHRLFDTVRPLNGALYTNSTDAERTVTTNDNFTAFNSGGFSLGATSSTNGSNASGSTFAAWTWDAGSSTVTNTQGSITSQVRANPSAGFSIVSYTGNGVQGATVGHGLGVAPSMVIYKSRDGSLDWLVYHSALGATQGIYLNQTLAAITSANFFNNTAPNSTTLYLNSAPPAGQTNTNGNRHLAYCFAPVAGYSSFGSYTGNGSTDGPFVFTGFRPRWVLIKGSSFATTGWAIYDAVRNTFNVANNLLTAESSSAETNYPEIDLLSNGFKLRGTNPTWNYSGQTHIYAAFAESSFAHSRAR